MLLLAESMEEIMLSLSALLGERVKNLRTQLDLTEQHLAQQAHVPLTTIRAIESGNLADQDIHLGLLKCLGRVLNAEPSQLIDAQLLKQD
jgi:transcriptional regulator with XRE-family HTH domain